MSELGPAGIPQAERVRRDRLYRDAGHTLFTCQLLESQLGIILAILNDKLSLQLDLHSLAAPDSKQTLGRLMRAINEFDTFTPEEQAVLERALEARNRVVHHFFVRNIDSFASERVFKEALAVLHDDERKIARCTKAMHAVYKRLCQAMKLDDDRIVVTQYRADPDSRGDA